MKRLLFAVFMLASIPALAQTTCFEETFNTSNGGMYGFGKFIQSSYTTNTVGGDGVQWHDDITISATDPDSAPPATPQLRAVGVTGGSVR